MDINLDALLEPISEEHPCGDDLSFSNDFHDIKKARTHDDPLLDQGDWVAEPKQADWSFVADKTVQLLSEKTKDIRLLTWLTEAWANLYGFEGLIKGLELSHRILEQYWLKLHPEIEDDDLDQRLGLLQGFTTQLPNLIKNVPLINIQPFYSLAQYESFLHLQNTRRKQAEDSDSVEASVELDQFNQALFNTSRTFQYQSYQQFQEILQHWNIIKQVLDALMELEAPSFASIDSQLENIQMNLKKIYKAESFGSTTHVAATEDNPVQANPVATNENHVHPIVQQAQGFQPQPQSHLQNREQAMRVLQDIADYFQTNEPHSPVSYMLQKTIKWSQMPLHEWLTQVIKNENPLDSIQELLGVNQNNESSEW
ncbi:type VI secretion system protein TssA [Acinetobacter wuhouensis]|uniref:type VI secretion system protein TssA n=1 Tax=Acinetobacter wuhouensis TaxID=1879050 RepID=UPI00083B9C83|nr:type VI secretion system protein TssA [Acinetobacter wuhouensis]AXQ23972.1 type VI secretion system protein TssA [Acinetobacter wuhouensis]